VFAWPFHFQQTELDNGMAVTTPARANHIFGAGTLPKPAPPGPMLIYVNAAFCLPWPFVHKKAA
jgi:hypothetical protein